MDFVNQLNEAVNPGGNPVIFYLIAGVALLVFIMMLRSILHIVVLLLGIGIIAAGVAYYNGYDFSGLEMPDMSSMESTTSSSSEESSSSNNISSSGIENTISDTINKSLPDFGNLLDGTMDNITDIINQAVRNISK